MLTKPVSGWVQAMLGNSGVLTLIASVLLLFFALKFLVDLLKTVLASGAERAIHATLFRSPTAAIGAGAAITAAVQSSSITTSTVIPLVGAGVVTLEQVFPFTVGANLGTTITAILAALQIGEPEAITVAFAHFLFNVSGLLIIYVPKPMRWIPLTLARKLGALAARRRALALFYLVLMFYVLPLALLFASGILRPSDDETPPIPAAVEEPLDRGDALAPRSEESSDV